MNWLRSSNFDKQNKDVILDLSHGEDISLNRNHIVFNGVRNSEPTERIICGTNSTFVLHVDGTVSVFGVNRYNALTTDSGTNHEHTPVIAPKLAGAKEITGCNGATMVLKNDEVWAIGSNWTGQLGLGDTQDRTELVKVNINDVNPNGQSLEITLTF